ncbi:MAG TPA: tRNA (adenosine(37)-N6)-threonylcarbamoyltransferase complex ATPase subunit type 1 TsaE [Thermoanaerobaculia bacterium]|nr:tRNA (adenosine(37)-N6)-threonylcarbamoyltransferase complex ATPase subunit type 1 TsaE [Thermoanaerobaculia bacterium]
MPKPLAFHCRDEAETEAAGRAIAKELPADCVVHLAGDLGAGKTFLVRAIASALGASREEISSPTFALVHEYPIPDHHPIIHIDGYRMSENPREWMEIGIPELLSSPGIKFIEWPKEGFAGFSPEAIEIRIGVNEDQSREIEVRPFRM